MQVLSVFPVREELYDDHIRKKDWPDMERKIKAGRTVSGSMAMPCGYSGSVVPLGMTKHYRVTPMSVIKNLIKRKRDVFPCLACGKKHEEDLSAHGKTRDLCPDCR